MTASKVCAAIATGALMASCRSGEPPVDAALENREAVVVATTMPTSTLPSTTTTTLSLTTAETIESTQAPVSTSVPPAAPVAASIDSGSAAALLAPRIVLPSDCPLPLGEPESLPNAARSYRSGIHQGIDFICAERGRSALAALDGRVVMAVDGYVDPTPTDRSAVLDTAAAAGDTPRWTLAMLYGNFVVIDHGVIDGVGHVATIYAHLESVSEDLAVGEAVSAGDLLGEIGNRGTSTASSGGTRAQSLHLHWEIEIDGEFLGAGDDPATTRAVYAELFGRS